MSEQNIVIVGAGVIGLTVCQQLLAEIGGKKKVGGRPIAHNITIVSKFFPIDNIHDYTYEYTSPWAGAHFRPFPHRLNVDDETYSSDKRESGYTRATMDQFVKKDFYNSQNNSSVQIMKGQDYLSDPTEEYVKCLDGYNSKSLKKFRKVLSSGQTVETELASISYGCEYETFCLNAPRYLNFLISEIKKLSEKYSIKVSLVEREISSLKQVVDGDLKLHKTDLIFNCSGLGLQWNSKSYDPKCFKIRGQTLLVDVPEQYRFKKSPYDNKTITYQTSGNLWTFVIKRPDPKDPYNSLNRQFIIGGTKQLDDTRTTPREADTQVLIERAKVLFPELIDPQTGNFKIAKVNVGFRPARIGGSKVDLQYHKSGANTLAAKRYGIINCYGFGGMGYECSIGAANHCVELYNQYCRQSKL